MTDAAHRAGVTRATLYRWLTAFDPDRPRASLRPQKRGPKAPRWKGEVLGTVINLIHDHPDLWGRHRVTVALAKRGITVSEATVSRILREARKRISIERDRAQRARRSRRTREVAAMIRRDERDARREAETRQWFEDNITRGITPEEAIQRIAVALSEISWRIQTKDLTPTLRELADAYRRAVCNDPELPAEDEWLRDSSRWQDQDHARVAALNHWVRRHRRGDHSVTPVCPLSVTS
jgi:transposase